MTRTTRLFVPVLLGLLLVAIALVPAGAVPRRFARMKLQMYEAVVDTATAQQVSEGGYDVVSIDPLGDGQVHLELVLYPFERRALLKLGVDLTVWRNDNGLTATRLASLQESSGFKVWRDYDGPGGIRDWMYDFAAAHPRLTDLQVIGHSLGTNPTGTGPDTPREILALKLTANADDTPDGTRPAVLYSSLQHAREWISTEVNRRLLVWFVKKYEGGSVAIRDLLGSTELWFVLVANPDGYQYTFDVERLWRKNLRDNDGDNRVTPLDGVDPNRNYPEHWNFDDEGSESLISSETYRGTEAGSEAETQAIMGLYDRVPFRFHVNYHSFGELLLYTFGFQVNTPSADDPVFVALSGTDKHPAIAGYDPGVGADLYTTNGETTDWAHTQGALAWTPELDEGPNGDGFIFPDAEGAIQAEFNRNLPFARSVAMSAGDPDDPRSSVGIDTEPFYLDVSEIDSQKSHNPMSDFSFDVGYGSNQTVEVLAKRSLGDVTAHWSIKGGGSGSIATSEWGGGERYGAFGDDHYRIVRGQVPGLEEGNEVTVWFTGGGETSDPFTFEVIEDEPAEVLVLAAEDYSGAANDPAYASSTQPNYLSFYTAALDANDVSYDVYDVDAMDRQAPDHVGVLSHYEAVIWYQGNDYLTREPGQAAGTGASTLANSEMLEVRAYLNEGGRLLHTGRHAGWQFFSAFPYNPVETPPYCDGTVNESSGLECLLLSDDFYQYWLGAALFIEDGGTVGDEPAPIEGVDPTLADPDPPFAGFDWTLNEGTSADNHHANPVRGTTQSLITTSSLLKVDEYPQFTSTGPAVWNTGVAGAFEPHGGTWYVHSDRGDISYKRLTSTISVPASGNQALSFMTSYDTEPAWDFLFVEAHTPGQDDWVTLPNSGGDVVTSNSTGDSCPEGWHEIHPSLVRYQGADCSGAGWNAVSGRSAGWEEFRVNLAAWAGKDVEVSISYVSDWSVQGLGVFLDDIDAPGTADDTNFESGLGGWSVPGAPPSSTPNPNDFHRTQDVGFIEAAVTTMDPPGAGFRTMYFGFGFEGITSQAQRNDVMARALDFLLS